MKNCLYINGRCLERKLTGVERYTLAVLNELDKCLEKYNLKTYLLLPNSDKYDLHYKNIEIKKVGFLHGVFWEQLELPFYARRGYLLSLHSIAPLLKKNQIMVMHDAKVSRKGDTDESEANRLFHYILSILLGKFLNTIITITEFAKDDISQGFYIKKNKIKVVLGGADLKYKKIDSYPSFYDKYNFRNFQYVLGVGGGSKKNNELTAKAVELINKENVYFVLAGSVPDIVKRELEHYKHTIMLGRVSDDELRWLYQNALCMSFPSIVEGFGRPPLEAMLNGCPVIASRCQAVPEVCGNAALYINETDPNDVKEKIEMIMSSSECTKQLIDLGKQNLKRFNWKKTAEDILFLTIKEMERGRYL